MTLITQLSREDVMFVAGETESIYQHVALLATLDTGDRPEFDFEHFRRHCMERVSLIPQFRWKLHTVPMGLDRPYWVEDTQFSFDHHIRHIALPGPGDKATLCEVAAYLYCKHLDRARPLWEMWLIEGLEGGKFAYLQKFHHCLMDGEGAFKMLETICDFEPEPANPKTVERSISDARAGSIPSFTERSAKAWRHLARLPGEATRNAVDILRPKILEQFVWPRRPKSERPAIPTACFNGPIGSDRAMTFAALSMARLKKVKTGFGVSLNEVVLALVSSAVRNYLMTYAQLPLQPLRTNIPVSLRVSGDEQLSNKVTNTTITLATDLEDPAARLRAIHEESEQAKARAHSGAPGMIEMFQMMPPIMISTLMDSLPADQAPQMVGANLIVSNVRGSAVPLYIAGARMETIYPMSILTAGMGINFTCVSYSGTMYFGIIVEPDLVPHHHVLAEALETALAEYLALCKPKRSARPKRAARAAKKTGRLQPGVERPASREKPGRKSASRQPDSGRKRRPT